MKFFAEISPLGVEIAAIVAPLLILIILDLLILRAINRLVIVQGPPGPCGPMGAPGLSWDQDRWQQAGRIYRGEDASRIKTFTRDIHHTPIPKK